MLVDHTWAKGWGTHTLTSQKVTPLLNSQKDPPKRPILNFPDYPPPKLYFLIFGFFQLFFKSFVACAGIKKVCLALIL